MSCQIIQFPTKFKPMTKEYNWYIYNYGNDSFVYRKPFDTIENAEDFLVLNFGDDWDEENVHYKIVLLTEEEFEDLYFDSWEPNEEIL